MSLFGISIYLHLASKKQVTDYFELLARNNIKLIFMTLIFLNKE